MTQAKNETTWRWNRHSFWAMNTTVDIKLFSSLPVTPVLEDIERHFNSFEKRLSRFLPGSELSKLNRCQQATFNASPTLFDAMQFALLAAKWSGGLFDPAILPNLEESGYKDSFEMLAQPYPLWVDDRATPPPPVMRKKSQTTFHVVSLNRARWEIIRPPGVKLDLGGMGKGWTVDRAADRLQGIGPFLINAGGDIFAYHTPPGEEGWLINLIHPANPDCIMAQLRLNHQALATSTIAKRRWIHQGKIYHHLIDPRTGLPAQSNALSVTVIADRVAIAEVLAKVALILGVDKGLAYLENIPNVEGLIYSANGEIICTNGMDAKLL